MSFLSNVQAKAKSLLSAAEAFLRGLWEKAAAAGFVVKIREALGGLLDRIPEEKRRLAVGIMGGSVAVLLLLIIAVVAEGRGRAAASPPANAENQRAAIPGDELFLPDEPDFIPGVLLEREQRGSWTAEDAAPWWQDPLKNGEEPWRERIEMTADAILEQVP